MDHLIDSNVFLRLADKTAPQHTTVLAAIRKLRSRGEILCYTPQVLSEFWNVCTRPPAARGGFGFSVEQTSRKADIIAKYFRLLPDNIDTFNEWRKLVSDHKIKGVQVHDAKLVASMIVHRIPTLISFNQKDFKRFPMITVILPKDV